MKVGRGVIGREWESEEERYEKGKMVREKERGSEKIEKEIGSQIE